ncbi:MAG: porin family protein [Xanthobacteraceae bacterium]|nr:porin family protein [Xanthobacteraceae bacterium]
MKRLAVTLLSGASVFALTQVAPAADMAVKALASPPAVAATWSGLYIGVHGGAGWQSAPNWSFADRPALLVFDPQTLTGTGNLGAVGGLQAGYNWQFAPAWLLGVEGDFSWASLTDHRTLAPLTFNGGTAMTGSSASMSANTQWLSSARARVGYVGWNNTLLYFTGGAAWANVEYNGQSMVTFLGTPVTSQVAATTTKAGWVLGGGAEWMATPNIMIRAEYLYYNLNNNISLTGPVLPVQLGGTQTLTYGWSNYNVQVARVAASYKF